jgi:hypothetical protein
MGRECKKIQQNLIAYLDGELAQEGSQAIATHLHGCTLCQQEVRDLQESLAQVLAWKDILPSEHYDQRFWEKIKSSETQVQRERGFFYLLRSLLTQNFNIATSVAFAVILVLTTFFLSRPSTHLKIKDNYMVVNMELFLNMDVIEHADALEHFEVIEVLDQLEKDTAR